MVSVQDVRDFLKEITTQFVGDPTVRKQITMAEVLVNQEKGANITEEVLEQAILAKAAHLTYLAYATYIERSTGRVPEPMLLHLGELKDLAETMLGYARRGAVVKVTVADLAKGIWKDEIID